MKYQIMAAVMVVALSAVYAQVPEGGKTALIYKNDACAHCTPYLAELLPSLARMGYDVKVVDFINSKAERANLAALQEKFGVPLQLQGHMVVALEGKYLFEGHVPVDMIEEFMQVASENDTGTVFIQDKMSGADRYVVWKDGEQKTFGITEKYSPADGLRGTASSLQGTSGGAAADARGMAGGTQGWDRLHLDGRLLFPASMALAPLTLVAYYIVKKED